MRTLTCIHRRLLVVTFNDITERKLAEETLPNMMRKLIEHHEKERTPRCQGT